MDTANTSNEGSVSSTAIARDEARLKSFGEALDAIRVNVEAKVGAEDIAHVRRVEMFSRTMEVIGRGLIHISFEPISFVLGVIALWIHKQLQATEIGHTALHGAYDTIEGADEYRSKTYKWEIPIDEESWRHGHNVRHHGGTNIAGRDPDIHFGPMRLTEQTPYTAKHRFQLPFALFVLAPNFTFLMNLHFTGIVDYWHGNGRPEEFDFIKDRSRKTAIEVHKKALRKYVRYYAKEYVFFPLLAGPFFWKIILGNWLSEVMRDIYSAATIYCGHVGEDVASYPEGTKAKGRGAFYAMQIAATNNFEVSYPVSLLCGALDLQIEHHLFPRLAGNRLREIAPQVREACRVHGVEYRTASWGKTLLGALKHVAALSREGGLRGVMRAMA